MGTALQTRKHGTQQKSNGRFAKGNTLAKGVTNHTSRARRFITQQIISMLNEVDRKTGDSNLRVMVRNVVTLAKAGDMQAVEFVTNRVEGKVPQAVEVSGRDGAPIETITATMTLAEAARLYAMTVADEDGCVIEHEELPREEVDD